MGAMSPVLLCPVESIPGLEKSRVFGNARGAGFEKGEDPIDDCWLPISDSCEQSFLTAILKFAESGTASEQARSFRFLCHVGLIRG